MFFLSSHTSLKPGNPFILIFAFSTFAVFFIYNALNSLAPIGQSAQDISNAVSSPASYDESISLYEIDSRAAHSAGGNLSLLKRDDYSCAKGTPCKEHACCGGFFGGKKGVCGFGPAFCGSDCDSQCNAKSECGQYANPAGKACPLNVCCSKYGFCGSTADFCTKDCQSNCVIHPPLPPGKSSKPVLNRVIGYYEAWSARRKCYSFSPRAIPVDGLTHVNFAFAYINPSSLKITPMDSATPANLFTQTADIKSLKSRGSQIQVFVSIGGWTFSDNDTTTQDVFPSIAGSASNRKKFANNLVSFMEQYGFDGVDLDWEYPGAPDRGGKGEADVKNFVSLLKAMRDTFESSAEGRYGISFTIPSSYWYLRWFDVPSLLKYADWVNLMSYDLHGIWDKHNPIGSVVHPHTNLTEIGQALDLLWRNKVPPGKVVLGLGFYGRAFQLADSKCAKPGCKFKESPEPGPCTNSSGTLAYFEIMDIIKDQKLKPTHDKEAAVKWAQYGSKKDQWVSFDDKETLQAKVKWANKRGLGGVMIWSVDQDDDQFSALTGLVGGHLPSFQAMLKETSVDMAQHWAGLNGQNCRVSDCVYDDKSSPPPGYALAPNGGGFSDKCKHGKKKYIYCPASAMPTDCQWRGSGSCHGQCHAGESTLAKSSHGSKKCAAPGEQSFCCVDNTWANLIRNCGFKKCGVKCTGDTPYELSKKTWTIREQPVFDDVCVQRFCCGYDFKGCHWVGKGSCDQNECSAADVQVGLDSEGDTGSSCWSVGRSKPLCCNPPKNTSPFLPVPLENLFPTLPPPNDVPQFDLQFISAQQLAPVTGDTGVSPQQAFGFVVIDGPPDAVGSLSRRDGSHIQFITPGVKEENGTHRARYICMDTSDRSNCNDMHLGGIEGKIFKMPEEHQFASYAVAHSSKPADDQRMPMYWKARAPPNVVVHELEYSYNFSLTKRADSDIYVRIDYADSHEYYEKIVAAKHGKRGEHAKGDEELGPRFWSKKPSIWKSLIKELRSNAPGYTPLISDESFDVLLYGNNGKKNKCSGGQDGFLKMGLSGSVRNDMRFGVTLIGRIAPQLSLEEAYGFFDSNPTLSATFSFDGKGKLDIPKGTEAHLFRSALSSMEFSHPGLVSFSPKLNVLAQIAGSGDIDGKFSMRLRSEADRTLTTNAPADLGTFTGSAAGSTLKNAYTGDFTSDEAGEIFRLKLETEAQLQMQVFGYGTSLPEAAVNFTSHLPHYFRIHSEQSRIIVTDADGQAISEVYDRGNRIPGWDDIGHAVGHAPSAKIVHTGSSQPASRSPPQVNGYAIFGGLDVIGCSGNGSSTLVCPPPNRTLELFPELADDPDGEGSGSGGASQSLLEKRVGGERDFDVHGPNGTFTIFSHTYINGRNGRNLLRANPDAGYWVAENPRSCLGFVMTGGGSSTGNTYVTEHILELQTLPRFLEFIMGVEQDLGDGSRYTTRLPVVTQRLLQSDLVTRWELWDPQNSAGENETPIDDLWRQFGDEQDSSHLVNAEEGFNGIKARLWGGKEPMGDKRWTDENLDDTTDPRNAENAISVINEVIGFFSYMNADEINANFAAAANGVRGVLVRFQGRFNAVNGVNFEIVGQWDEYLRNVMVPRMQNAARQWIHERLERLETNWTRARQNARTQREQQQAQEIVELIEQIQDSFIDPDGHNGSIDLSGLHGAAPSPSPSP